MSKNCGTHRNAWDRARARKGWAGGERKRTLREKTVQNPPWLSTVPPVSLSLDSSPSASSSPKRFRPGFFVLLLPTRPTTWRSGSYSGAISMRRGQLRPPRPSAKCERRRRSPRRKRTMRPPFSPIVQFHPSPSAACAYCSEMIWALQATFSSARHPRPRREPPVPPRPSRRG